MNILEIKHVIKEYENKKALDSISLNVNEGRIFGLLGPNGAGKTTLIRIINQITAPDKGEILFSGERFKREHIQNIGYLPEERGLYKSMKVGEQCLYLAQLKGLSKNEAKQKIHHWFKKLDMLDKATNIMNKKPITATKDLLISSAITLMNKNSITSLLITKKDTPIGIVNLKTCLENE